MEGSPHIYGWLIVGMAKPSRKTAGQDGRSARATQASVPRRKKTLRASMRTHYVRSLRQMTEKAIPRRAPLSLQPRALGLSVQDARAHVMCGHRHAMICWQRLAGHCGAPHAPSVPPTEPCGRSVPVQIPQRLEPLGPQPTSACSRATFPPAEPLSPR